MKIHAVFLVLILTALSSSAERSEKIHGKDAPLIATTPRLLRTAPPASKNDRKVVYAPSGTTLQDVVDVLCEEKGLKGMPGASTSDMQTLYCIGKDGKPEALNGPTSKK